MSSSVLSEVSRTPLAPNCRVPPRRLTPGARVNPGAPTMLPRTSMSSTPALTAASSSRAVETVTVCSLIVLLGRQQRDVLLSPRAEVLEPGNDLPQ